MAETSLQDIKDFHDVIRLLHEHPEWRDELRRVVLTDELLALPHQVARLTEQIAALAVAQVRTDAHVAELAAAQARTEAQLTTLTARVDELAAAQARTEAQLTTLTARVDELAAAQARTETQLATLTARVDELAVAQARTEAQLATLTARVDELAVAQARTEAQLTTLTARVDELAVAQARTEAQLATLTARVDELAAAQARTETRLAALADTVQRLSSDVGTLKGDMLELRYGVRGVPSVGRILRRSHVLSPDEVYKLLDDAVDHGVLSDAERDQLIEADLLVRGKDRTTGSDVYLVMEVSWGVGPVDVQRAAERAALLAKLGIPTISAVAGRDITREARESALRQGVWQFIDGTVVPPESRLQS
jgi:cell division protein FtsB